MNIDFHYGVVYIVARIGGMPAGEALTVAHACQYVDDATTSGILRFSGGETFERFATAHKLFDYTNTDNDQNRLVWAPFHFRFFRSSSGCAAGSSAGASPAKRTLDARGVNRLLQGWLRQNAA
ncbi:DUF6765 family protein, partial [Paraburkholderia elongata]|uniref:DUF6765 family protein n=1 Tax=Paraburkholderia elongata TaxID=2675747 RepID=UPI002E2871BF